MAAPPGSSKRKLYAASKRSTCSRCASSSSSTPASPASSSSSSSPTTCARAHSHTCDLAPDQPLDPHASSRGLALRVWGRQRRRRRSVGRWTEEGVRTHLVVGGHVGLAGLAVDPPLVEDEVAQKGVGAGVAVAAAGLLPAGALEHLHHQLRGATQRSAIGTVRQSRGLAARCAASKYRACAVLSEA